MENFTVDEAEMLASFFKVLGDKTRTSILLLLANQEMNVTSIAESLGMEQSAISHQLKVLRDYRMVISRREKKSIYYRPNDDHIYQLLMQTLEHIREEE